MEKILKENIRKEDTNQQNTDYFVMGMQDMVYRTVSDFLKSQYAIDFNIVGLDVKIEEGYINASWKFGNRKEGDIKDG